MSASSTPIHVAYSERYDQSIPVFGRFQLALADRSRQVRNILVEEVQGKNITFITPDTPDIRELDTIHDPEYLERLTDTALLARIFEVPWLRFLPFGRFRKRLLGPFVTGAEGTRLACEAALSHGASVNLFGGFHHAHPAFGHGLCPIADVPYALDALWKRRPSLRVLIIDLDAHLGDGHAAFFAEDERVSIIDAYNSDIFPASGDTHSTILHPIPLPMGCVDSDYETAVFPVVAKTLKQGCFDLVIYLAGSDVYRHDGAGWMNLSRRGIERRDELVIEAARLADIPIVLLPAGGYHKHAAAVFARCISKLIAGRPCWSRRIGGPDSRGTSDGVGG